MEEQTKTLKKVSISYPNGNCYCGEIKNEVPDGFGKMTFANFDWYEGEWADGKMMGKGEYHFYDSKKDRYTSEYEGYFYNNEFSNFGKMKYSNKTWYLGEWERGKRNGSGTLFSSTGKMSGIWIDDILAYGTLCYPDGRRYVGEISNNMLNGRGTLFNNDGSWYHGEWRDNKMVSGAFYASDGIIKQIITKETLYKV